jgi:SAM-dependent methyltransferase
LLQAVPPGGLGDGLEIGGGDGYVASLISPACRTFISSDSYMRQAAEGTAFVPRLVCDAACLPFKDASFDFIFSSSVLEHIRDRQPTYRAMARCLRPGGLMIHVMPSRTWKLLQMLFYYPSLVTGGIDLVLDAMTAPQRHTKALAADDGVSVCPGRDKERWGDATRVPSWRRILKGVVPTVHGEYANHLREWQGFGAAAWACEFRAAGFDVHRVIRLPLYSGYGFGFERLRRFGEHSLGWSSHNAFILTRAGETPPCRRWFDAPKAGIGRDDPRRLGAP